MFFLGTDLEVSYLLATCVFLKFGFKALFFPTLGSADK